MTTPLNPVALNAATSAVQSAFQQGIVKLPGWEQAIVPSGLIAQWAPVIAQDAVVAYLARLPAPSPTPPAPPPPPAAT